MPNEHKLAGKTREQLDLFGPEFMLEAGRCREENS